MYDSFFLHACSKCRTQFVMTESFIEDKFDL